MLVCVLCLCVNFFFVPFSYLYAATNPGLDWLDWTCFFIWSGVIMLPLWFALPLAPLPFWCSVGIGKLSTADGKAFADPEVLRRLTSSVSCALDEAAAALTRMRAENTLNAGQADKYVSCP